VAWTNKEKQKKKQGGGGGDPAPPAATALYRQQHRPGGDDDGACPDQAGQERPQDVETAYHQPRKNDDDEQDAGNID